MIESALSYTQKGWHVLPLHSIHEGKCTCGQPCPHPGKHPRLPNGHKDASSDPAVVSEWWTRWPDANIGVSLEPSNLIVLDIDVKRGAPGLSSLEAIDDEIPETLTAETGSGGYHDFFVRPPDVRPARKIGFKPGIDLLGKGYVVVSPSLHESGRRYEWLTPDIVPAPMPSVLRAQEPERPVEPLPVSPLPPAPPELLEAVREALQAHGPAIEGQGGDQHTYVASAIVFHDYGLSEEEGWPLLLEWNQTCAPPWEETDLATKAQNAATYSEGPFGEKRRTWEVFRQYTHPPTKEGLWLEALVPAILEEHKRPPVKTPFPSLDEALGGGFRASTITLVTAGTGKGKTAFATTLGTHHGTTGGTVVYYLGELTPPQLAARIVAQRTKATWRDVLTGYPEEKMRAALRGIRMVVVPRQAEPVRAIAKQLDELIGAGDCGQLMLIVDYIQLLADIGRDMRISTMQAIRDVQTMTLEGNLITVALSQTSRFNSSLLADGGGRDAEDYVGTAAESAALEADAANVLALSFKSVDGVESHDVTCMVAKARFRGPSKIGLTFFGASGQWEERVMPKEPSIDDRIFEYVALLNGEGRYPTRNKVKTGLGLGGGSFDKAIGRLIGKNRPLELITKDPETGLTLKDPGLKARAVGVGG